jgi:rod shape-determining protein MreC
LAAETNPRRTSGFSFRFPDVTRFSKICIWILLGGVLLFLLSSGSGGRSGWNLVEQLAVEATAPFQKLVTLTIRATRDFWYGYFDLVDVRRENRRLKTQIDALTIENTQYRELLAAHRRLQELLQFRHAVSHPVLAAGVIGRDPSGWFKSIVIDKGGNSGVVLDMPVVNAEGVVGRIVSVSPNYAKALLLIDQNSAIDCLLQRSRDRCMAKGVSGDICKLVYADKSSDISVGDMVITSGLGGVFPKGLPVGQVLHVRESAGALFKDIDVLPAVDFSKLEEVLVVLKENRPSNPKKNEK